MKSVLFPAVLALCGFGMPQQLEAQKLKKDPESYRVIVTLSDSSTVEGYLKKGWHADNSFLKTENYSFKLVKNPDDKEPVKYTAEEVLSIDYAGGSEQNPDGIRWESHAIASPGIGNRTGRCAVWCVWTKRGRTRRSIGGRTGSGIRWAISAVVSW